MKTFDKETLDRIAAAGLDPERLPRHVAVIMDGNGRWARQRGMPRVEGHLRGVQSVRATVEECCRLGLDQLTLYCLSSENWKRPQHELDFLMTLLHKYLLDERAEIMGQNIRFTVIGRRAGMPDNVLAEIDENIRVSAANTGMTLALAINYGARTEIVDAVRGHRRARASRRVGPGRHRRGHGRAAPCTRRGCPIRTCWSAPPARCASATICCGKSPTPNCG